MSLKSLLLIALLLCIVFTQPAGEEKPAASEEAQFEEAGVEPQRKRESIKKQVAA